LNLISNKKLKRIFLTKKTKVDFKNKVDLVLSPEFYWVRKFEIPVKNEKEALKVLPTLYEDILPDEDFEYYCLKTDESKFICFAYNNNTILEHIKNSGLQLSQIRTVYFAQFQMESYESFEIDENAYVYEKDILIKIPKNMILDIESLSNELEGSQFNNHKINMKFYSNVINSKYIYSLVILLGLLVAINALRYYSFDKENNNINERISKIKKNKNMPKTNIQTKSILQSMKKKIDSEIELRKAVAYILTFKKSRDSERIEKISFKENKIKVIFSNSTWRKIKGHIEKKYKISSNSTAGSFVTVVVDI